MSLLIYNTLTRTKEPFTPIDPSNVRMYVCGPTVYNYVHVGNARPAVVFDLLYRLLKRSYPNVTYARNLTDVDDKINQAAAKNGESISVLAGRFAQAYREDMAQLNVLAPDLEPKATDNIDAMLNMIQRLLDAGNAYEADGHVLFAVSTFADYGKLSGRQIGDMRAGARVAVEDYKRDAGDFVLWKPSKEGEPAWPSPWGDGRPGWHLECSAMIERHLGKSIDIHGGGQDLVFPHHENEIAQSCCANPHEPYVRYWMHNGYLTIDKQKMAKSAGNFVTVREALTQYPGEVIRYALLSAHYRGPLEWTAETLTQAQAAMDRCYQALRPHAELEPVAAEPDAAVLDALHNDLNTPVALARLHELVGELNRAQDDSTRSEILGVLLASAELMGLLAQDAEAWFQADSGDGLQAEQIDALVKQRQEAKAGRDFARADAIREQLAEQGIVLEDSADGTRWRRAESN
jgi:cysteinyl-tRNA synthetase